MVRNLNYIARMGHQSIDNLPSMWTRGRIYQTPLLLEATYNLNNAIWVMRGHAPPTPNEDIRIGDIMDIIERFIHKASCWGTH